MLFNDPKSVKNLLISIFLLDILFIALSVLYIMKEIEEYGYSAFPYTSMLIGLSIGAVLAIGLFVFGKRSKKIITQRQYETLFILVIALPSYFLYRLFDNGEAMIGCIVTGGVVFTLLLLYQYIQVKKETNLN